MEHHSIEALCWQDGTVLPALAARISVLDHGLLYGDGVFEGIRFYQRRPFRLDAHLQRLQRSARALALQLPLSLQALQEAVAQLLAAFAAPDGYLRLVVTRGVGPLGLDPRRCGAAQVFIIADQLALVDAQTRQRGARAIIAATRRLSADGLDARIKSLNYLNPILARIEASNAGADEAILLNAAGRVAEGSADNVFIVRDGALATPPGSEGALEGVTRAAMLELARELGIPAREMPLTPYDLYTADEGFLTGTGAELIPLREIDGRVLPHVPGPVFSRLQQAFAALVARETA
jgi:branched-chain amino acid aminotransferase